MVYVITGGPAVGKGTRSDILANALNIPHISTGDLIREVAKTDKEISDKLSRGELISDDIMTRLLENRLSKDDCKNGVILDGYPRTIAQIKLLDNVLSKFNMKVDKVIELTVPDELVFKRILGRKKCEKCGKMYGVDFPPKVANVCDDCGGNLYIRTDDTKETLKNRINIYKENSKDILKYYKGLGILKTVDSSTNPELIIKEATED